MVGHQLGQTVPDRASDLVTGGPGRLTETIEAPPELNTVSRTIFSDDASQHFYDQIAWFSEPDVTCQLHSMTYTQRVGSFDFVPHFMSGLTRNELSWRLFDPYPLWVEFQH